MKWRADVKYPHYKLEAIGLVQQPGHARYLSLTSDMTKRLTDHVDAMRISTLHVAYCHP